MSIDERSRHELFLKLEQVLGAGEATTLMEHLPPVGWADVATKRDLDELQVATKRDLDELQVATKRDLDELQVGTRKDLDSLKNELLAQFRAEINGQTRTMLFTMSTLMTTIAALAFAAARLA
jgi:hypothetical protein